LGIKINPGTDFLTGYVDCDVTLQHPFKSFAMYRGFDVRGIFMSDGTMAVGSVPGLFRAGPGEARVLNADGYTRWWNPSEFGPEGKIFGFQMGRAGFQYHPSATVNPYKYFADDLDPIEGVELLDPATRGTFSTMPGLNTRNYVIQFPMDGPKPDLRFQYAIDASWYPPDPAYAPDYPIEAFSQSAQMREAYHIRAWDDGSTAYYQGPGDFGGEIRLAIEVFDWQTPSTGPSTELAALYVESPLLPTPVDVLPGAVESPGTQTTSRIYSVVLDGLVLSGAGVFEVLIAAQSSVGTYKPNLEDIGPGWIYPDEPLTAVALVSATVLGESPNNPPVAVADQSSPLSGYSPLTVHLDPTGSYDPDDPPDYIALYEWDIGADGTYEYDNTDGSVVNHVFDEVGTHYVQLRVTDSFGAWDLLDNPLEIEIIEGTDEWPLGFYDAQNTCYNPNSHVSFPLNLVYKVNYPGHHYTQLVVGRGNIYMTDSGGYIRCLDEESGSQLWYQDIHTTTTFWTGCSPGLWNDHVIVGGTGIHSFNADTGSPDWHVYDGQSFDHQGLVIVGDTVYFRSTSSSYASIDAATGAQNWFISWSTYPLMTTAYGEAGGQGYCVAPYSSSERCVYAGSGGTVWTQNCGGNAFGNVIVIGEYAYFGCNTLYKKHLATGANAATYALGGWQPLGMWISDTDIFFVVRDTSGTVYKLMSFDFDLNFHWETPIGINNEHGVYVDGYVWITEGASVAPQYLRAYDASDGTLAYTYPDPINSNNPIWGGITNVNNHLYLTNQNYGGAHLFCFETAG
jgi:hypothetical protein